MVHTPMLASYMPANLHYFLVYYLNLLRLNSKKISNLVDIWYRELGLANYDLIVGGE